MRKEKILVVEDEVIIALDLKKTLNNLGYAVIKMTTSGEEAVKIAEKMHPDLALMDIKLKGNLNGIEAAKRIQDRFNIPVIYVTAYSDRKTLGLMKKTGPFLHVSKPFVDEGICAVIEKAFSQKKVIRKREKSKTEEIGFKA